jgi:hypothetical protein
MVDLGLNEYMVLSFMARSLIIGANLAVSPKVFILKDAVIFDSGAVIWFVV